MVLTLTALLMLIIALVVMLLLRQNNKRALIGMLIGLPILTSLGLVVAFVVWIDHDYMIPEESNFFDLKITQDSGGNGNYWIYAEDSNYYYTTLGENAQDTGYQVFAKTDAEKITSFDPLNYTTWVEHPLTCGDLLQRYGREIPHLHYIDCSEEMANPQLALKARYRVSGGQSYAIEKILIEQYGMGPLVFQCCGWETAHGETGHFSVPELAELSPPYGVMMTMYSDVTSEADSPPPERDGVEFMVEVIVLAS